MSLQATTDSAPTALIAEDEPLLAAALQSELARAWPRLRVVASVGDGASAVAAVAAGLVPARVGAAFVTLGGDGAVLVTADGAWHGFGDENGGDPGALEALRAYATVQYDNLFNKDSAWASR